MKALPLAQQALGALPSALDALAQQAQQAAAQLAQRHGLTGPLRRLPALLGLPPLSGAASAAAEHTGPPSGACRGGSKWEPQRPGLARTVGLPALPVSEEQGAEGRQAYAAGVVQSFRQKLLGVRLHGGAAPGARGQQLAAAAGRGVPPAAAGLGAEALAAALIEEASSEDNLARMYEGWMPFV